MTMAELKQALPTIFLHEGRYVDNIKDPGGATNFGISLRFLQKTGDLDGDGWIDGDINHDGIINIDDIKGLSPDHAAELYDVYWWSKYHYARIDDQSVATKVFDLSVNVGSHAAHICLQRAVRAASGISLLEDGELGDQSFKAINTSNPMKLLAALKSEAAGYYRLIRLKSGNEKTFIEGWLNRAYSDCVNGEI